MCRVKKGLGRLACITISGYVMDDVVGFLDQPDERRIGSDNESFRALTKLNIASRTRMSESLTKSDWCRSGSAALVHVLQWGECHPCISG